jgi:hypothetical protein
MQQKRGQAALEFLTTYGWAFMIMLVLVGGMAYFGVLSPSRLIPDTCIASSGFLCSEAQIAQDGIVIRLRNGPQSVTFSNPTVRFSGLTLECDDLSAVFTPNSVRPSQQIDITIDTQTCEIPSGARVTVVVEASYRIANDPFPKRFSVEVGASTPSVAASATSSLPVGCNDEECLCAQSGGSWNDDTCHCPPDYHWNGLACGYDCNIDSSCPICEAADDDCMCKEYNGEQSYWDSITGVCIDDNTGCNGDADCQCRDQNFDYADEFGECQNYVYYAHTFESSCEDSYQITIYSLRDFFDSGDTFFSEENSELFSGEFVFSENKFVYEYGLMSSQVHCSDTLDSTFCDDDTTVVYPGEVCCPSDNGGFFNWGSLAGCPGEEYCSGSYHIQTGNEACCEIEFNQYWLDLNEYGGSCPEECDGTVC